ncbi:MAG: hypothetical protein J1E82_04395 [Muribaculaceae bacterium]|nr:hypothetical protein [Muribaculaceae bacterium]
MKKLLLAFLPLMILCACGGKKISPEEEVRNYGKYFVEKLNANQLDSLKATYPDLTKADSIVPVLSDTIMVTETAPGQYDVTLAEGVKLKATRSEDGNISVAESKGLFAFPANKVDIAKKTGMWDDNLNDVQLNERMKDEDFFNHINKTKNRSNIITWGNIHVTKFPPDGLSTGYGYYILTNHTNVPIKGSDYEVLAREVNERFGAYSETLKGINLAPNGTGKLNISFSGHTEAYALKSIKWKIPESELMARFTTFTGNEYQEYLDSKK